MKANTAVRVFLASPMDVVEERQLFKRTVEKVNNVIGRNLGIYFEVVGWEDDVLPDAGIDAQDVVNSQIKQDYDVFVALFKSRVGTKTHRSLSGTIEEYELAQMKRRANPALRIMCYYLDATDCENEDIQSLKQKMNDEGVLYADKLSLQSFSELVFKHFSQLLLQFAKMYGPIKKKQSRVHEDMAVAVAIVIDERVILVRRSSNSTVGAGMWQIPGGKVDEQETPLCAAQREIQEELNLDLDKASFVLVSDVKTKNIKNNNALNLLLYMYRADDTCLPDIILNSENDEWELSPISSVVSDTRKYLGYNKQLMTILWRELYFVEPLEAVLKDLRAFAHDSIPSFPKGGTGTINNIAYAFLSAMGLLHFLPTPIFVSSYSEQIIEAMICLSRSNTPLFENTNVDAFRELHLPADEFPNLQMHREKMLFSHKSLMSVLSCKTPMKNGRRNVVDVLIFGEYNGQKYLLLRWDFYAKKYQLISGGINTYDCPSKEEKAAAIISRRFSEIVIHFFDYHEIAQIKTHHFSAGSIENDPILREYNVDVIVATPKHPQKQDFAEFVNTINSATELSVEYCWDISGEQAKKLSFFRWCPLDALFSSNNTFAGRKVRGLQEIITSVGRQTILDCSKRSICLSGEEVDSDIDKLIKAAEEKMNGQNSDKEAWLTGDK